MLKMFIILYKKYKFIPKISYLSKFIRKVVLKNMTKNTFFYFGSLNIMRIFLINSSVIVNYRCIPQK